MDLDFHVSISGLLCAAAISCPHFVGLYLFRAGVNDFDKGCREMGMTMLPLLSRLHLLKWLLPLCCVLRVFCAPAMWYWIGEQHDLSGGMRSLPVWLWVVLMGVPFVLFMQILMKPGMRSVLSSHTTMREWPGDCPTDRPYHGLLSTRCHAASGAFFIEILWNAWTMYAGRDMSSRLVGITIPIVIFYSGMLMGGPVNFLMRKPYAESWIAETYILVSIAAVEGFVLLNFASFGLKAAIDPRISPGGPYSHWSTYVWMGILAAQTLICRTALTSSKELKGGPPWSACGCDHKEFFFPRFWGMIFVCYGMMVCFNLWILGLSYYAPQYWSWA